MGNHQVLLIFSIFSLFTASADYQWIKFTDKQELPENAIFGGYVASHDKTVLLYIGRAHADDELIPGKVSIGHPVSGTNVPLTGKFWYIHNGKEHHVNNFELLVGPDEFNWIKMTSLSKIPINAVQGGHKKDGSPYYIGRATFNGRDKQIGKVDPSNKLLYTNTRQVGKTFSDYEILVWRNICY